MEKIILVEGNDLSDVNELLADGRWKVKLIQCVSDSVSVGGGDYTDSRRGDVYAYVVLQSY
jgi:hypothetical protein